MQPQRSAGRVPVWALVLAGVGTAVVLPVILGFALWGLVFPPGEAVATIDLRSPTAVAVVDLAPGDRLVFRADVAAATSLKSALRRVTLTARLAPPSGAEVVSSCAIYDGGARSSSSMPRGSRITGASSDCALVAAVAGRHTVRAQAAWGSLAPTEARLEVRRVAARR